ncbi:MAG: alanyl-tRNA editing protein [Lachnospiraceae bacterium]|jgi:tRNA synthetases class II (A)|nr:alanyl-tRNA editing protein [Lachnospiraceae bacterium]
MSTFELYYSHPYESDFEADIISIDACDTKENTYKVILNQTLFFPEAGGQSSDKGEIIFGDITTIVENVQIDKEGIITHYIHSSSPLDTKSLVNAEIKGRIDWEQRFSNMQQHSGEHIFSGIVHEKYGYDNVGFHLSDNSVTMDYNGYLTPDETYEIEALVNKVIADNVDITCSFPKDNELESMAYRCKGELSGDVRIVEIKGVDICACCCPHVAKTGEIGLLKVISSIKYKGGTRLSILCGFRALKYFSSLQADMNELRTLLSSELSEVVNNVAAIKNERDELKIKLREANKAKLISEIDHLSDSAGALIFTDEVDAKNQREALNYLIERRDNYCGILVGDDKKGYSYLIGSNSLDSTLIGERLKESFGAKGGGKKEMIQGFVEAKACDIKALLDSFPFI